MYGREIGNSAPNNQLIDLNLDFYSTGFLKYRYNLTRINNLPKARKAKQNDK